MIDVSSLGGLFAQDFMRNAFLAGIPIALLAGLVGYLLVLRTQVFTADALSHVAFTGALGALALGHDPLLGLFVITIIGGFLLGILGPRGRADDVVIGTVFSWVMGLGVLALALYRAGPESSNNGSAGVTVLFGSIFSLDSLRAITAAAVAGVLVFVVLGIARPLLFATVDPVVAAVRGVPVRLLGVGFLMLVAATTAEATQAVGALLLLGLLAAPAGAAQRLTARPYLALGLSAGFSVLAMGLGLTVSYLLPRVPPSFAIVAIAAGTYLLALAQRPGAGSAAPTAT